VNSPEKAFAAPGDSSMDAVAPAKATTITSNACVAFTAATRASSTEVWVRAVSCATRRSTKGFASEAASPTAMATAAATPHCSSVPP
jgi:hypothetical protein